MLRRPLALFAAVALAGSAAALGVSPARAASGAAEHRVSRASGASRVLGALDAPPTADQCLAATGGRCLTPSGLEATYDINGLLAAGDDGKGVTIGIVDSFGSPTIQNDIKVYDQQYGLPAAHLQIITPAGKPPAFDKGNSDMVGWAGETTLDVEVAHTMAPGANILLIETPTSETEGLAGFPQIIQAEQYVVSHHLVDILSQSFAATEATFTSPAQIRQLSAEIYPAAKAAGVTVLSSSGDNGPTDDETDESTLYPTPQTDWPTSDPLVTSVGGTMLDIGPDGTRAAPDAAWGGVPGMQAGGGGRSVVFPRPAFQDSVASVVGNHRGVPDLSLDAAESSGLITYGSYATAGGWSVGGGTSQASPMLAGIVALADQAAHARVGYLNTALYAMAKKANSGIVDVTRGNNDNVDANGQQGPVKGYDATAGYDLATGLGTVDGGKFVPALVAATKGQTEPLSAAGGPAITVTPSTTSSADPSAGAPSSTGTPPGISPSTGDPTEPTASSGHHGSSTAVPGIVGGVLVVVVLGAIVLEARRRAHR